MTKTEKKLPVRKKLPVSVNHYKNIYDNKDGFSAWGPETISIGTACRLQTALALNMDKHFKFNKHVFM